MFESIVRLPVFVHPRRRPPDLLNPKTVANIRDTNFFSPIAIPTRVGCTTWVGRLNQVHLCEAAKFWVPPYPDNYSRNRAPARHPCLVEVWLPGRGWVRIGPTAAVAPERLERSIDISAGAVRFNVPQNDLLARAWRRLQFNLDAINNLWNQWVLGYSPERYRNWRRRWIASPCSTPICVMLIKATIYSCAS